MRLLSSGPTGADAPTNDTYLISHYGKKRTDLRTWSGGVNCSYCHQADSAFNSTSIMVNPTFNASVPEHSLNAGAFGSASPNCTNSSCHNGGWMHNQSLTKPVLALENSTVCTACHDGSSYPVTTGAKELHNGTLNCTECHLLVKQDIHGVKYLQQDDTYSTSNTSAVDCVRCHNNNTALNNISMTRPLVADNNGSMFTHSDNASNGTRWNTTAYWTTTNDACEYCHSDTKHSSTATGLIETIRYGQTLNTTLTSDDIWCGGCHVQTATNYNGTQWTPIPPTIVTNNTGNNTTWDGTGQVWYNHSFMSTFNDTDCQACHGSLLSATPTTKEFAHKVAVGGFGADCISCHDIGGSAPKINVSMLNNSLSLHQNIQNYT
ncbi:MAG: hypothetical protein SCH70_14570, partial [Candidatus Methanoperedens sp.]|nr:hypothetical protein [Candidatus Methanoperedens sp.]